MLQFISTVVGLIYQIPCFGTSQPYPECACAAQFNGLMISFCKLLQGLLYAYVIAENLMGKKKI